MRLSIPSALLRTLILIAATASSFAQTGAPDPNESRALRLIAVGTEDEAREVLVRLAAGADFEAVARERSIDATGGTGGYLGDFSLDALNAQFRTALERVDPGVVTSPLALGGRFVMLRWGDPTSDPWQAAHTRAVDAFTAGDYSVARQRFTEAIREAEALAAPDLRLARSLTGLAETYRLEGNYAGAGPLYERVLDIREALQGPDHAELAPVLNNLGEAYRLSGDPASARSAFQRALEILEATGGDALDIALVLGNAAAADRDLQDPASAAAALDRSIALLESRLAADDPSLLATLRARADLALEEGSEMEARALYRRVLDTRWGGPGAESLASVLDTAADVVRLAYFRDGDLASALAALRTGLGATTPKEALYIRLRDLLLNALYIEGAEAVMEEAVRAFPASAESRLALGEVYLRAGFLLQAETVLAEAASILQSQPESPARREIEYRVYLRAGELSRSMGGLEEGILAYQRAQRALPDRSESRMGLGDLYLEGGRLQEAEAEYREALNRTPDLAEARRGLADVAMRRGDFARAAEEARRAVDLDPQLLTAQYSLAMASIRAGEPEEGQARLDAYRARQSELQEANGTAGRIAVLVRAAVSAFADGDAQRAVEQLREAIRERDAGPSLAVTWSPDTNLSVLYQKLGDYDSAARTLEEALDSGCCDRGEGFLVYRNLWHVAGEVGDEVDRIHYEVLYLRELDDALEAIAP